MRTHSPSNPGASAAYSYDDVFLDYATRTNFASAKLIVAIVRPMLGVKSVLDVGCAQGAWLRAWREDGVLDTLGVDGSYVDTSRLQIPSEQFVGTDVSMPFDLGRGFDLVQCLEVGEHLPAANAGIFVDNLVRHGSTILFSAAPPGQGGENHINERPYDYWRDLFRVRGYEPLDCIRPLVMGRPEVAFWYRYNTFLYSRRDTIDSLPRSVASSLVPAGVRLRDVSPPAHRLRKAVVRTLPFPLRQRLAKTKGRLHR